MQTYRFDTKISENGIISLPYTMPSLYGKEVKLFITVLQEDTERIKKTKAQEFVVRWAGFLKKGNKTLKNEK